LKKRETRNVNIFYDVFAYTTETFNANVSRKIPMNRNSFSIKEIIQ
jgi:hypothetical protein